MKTKYLYQLRSDNICKMMSFINDISKIIWKAGIFPLQFIGKKRMINNNYISIFYFITQIS